MHRLRAICQSNIEIINELTVAPLTEWAYGTRHSLSYIFSGVARRRKVGGGGTNFFSGKAKKKKKKRSQGCTSARQQ